MSSLPYKVFATLGYYNSLDFGNRITELRLNI